MTARSFHLGDILTVTTGILVAPRGVDALYDLLNYMTGDNLFTHQLPRAAEECAPALRTQFPDLAAVQPPTFDSAAQVESWLAEQVARYGSERVVEPLPADGHAHIDPLAELLMMAPGKPVLVVQADEPEGGAR